MDTRSYDADLQMFVEPEHTLDLTVLAFLKWMVQTGKLEGDTLPSAEEVSCP